MIHNDFEMELDWLERWAKYSPERTALLSGDDGRQLSYREFYQQSVNLAAVLRDRFQIKAGDRVACLAQNELEYLVLFFALHRLSAILIPINFRFTTAEVRHVVQDSGAQLLIVQSEFAEVAAPLAAEVKLWSFGGEDSLQSAVRVATQEILPVGAQPEDPCMILYTSGTTGFPKGAVLSYRMLFWNSINTGLRLNLTQNDVIVTFLPLFHTGGWNVLTTPCLHRGAQIVLLKKFEAEAILQFCESEKVSILFGVPTTMDLMRRSPRFSSVDLRSVRYAIVGGEPMPIEAIQAWEQRGIRIRQGYGLTEFGPNVFSLNEEDSQRKIGSIGFPNFYIQTKIINDAGETLPPGEVGELLLKGPAVMSGYWNNEKATRETLVDGWLHTGDLVRQDEEGYHYVVGRKKEMFISGGENVYPAEVEKVLRQFPLVREAAVIGVPHIKWGESGKAYVVFEEDRSADIEDLRAHCLRHLAKFKIPQEFVIVDQLPKTESGKIAKKLLR